MKRQGVTVAVLAVGLALVASVAYAVSVGVSSTKIQAVRLTATPPSPSPTAVPSVTIASCALNSTTPQHSIDCSGGRTQGGNPNRTVVVYFCDVDQSAATPPDCAVGSRRGTGTDAGTGTTWSANSDNMGANKKVYIEAVILNAGGSVVARAWYPTSLTTT